MVGHYTADSLIKDIDFFLHPMIEESFFVPDILKINVQKHTVLNTV